MHSKLLNIDGEVLLPIHEHTVPLLPATCSIPAAGCRIVRADWHSDHSDDGAPPHWYVWRAQRREPVDCCSAYAVRLPTSAWGCLRRLWRCRQQRRRCRQHVGPSDRWQRPMPPRPRHRAAERRGSTQGAEGRHRPLVDRHRPLDGSCAERFCTRSRRPRRQRRRTCWWRRARRWWWRTPRHWFTPGRSTRGCARGHHPHTLLRGEDRA